MIQSTMTIAMVIPTIYQRQTAHNFYYDNDLDTFGTEDKLCMCVVDGFYTADKEGDCDDTSIQVNPSKMRFVMIRIQMKTAMD